MAKASRKSTPAPAPAGKIVDAGSITMPGQGSLGVDARHMRWMDISDRGRPSSRNLVRQEAQRRYDAGEVPPGTFLKTLAADLCDWLKRHPDKPKSMAIDNIAKAIRDIWRSHR